METLTKAQVPVGSPTPLRTRLAQGATWLGFWLLFGYTAFLGVH